MRCPDAAGELRQIKHVQILRRHNSMLHQRLSDEATIRLQNRGGLRLRPGPVSARRRAWGEMRGGKADVTGVENST